MINDLIEEINELENKGFDCLEAIEVLKLAEKRRSATALEKINQNLDSISGSLTEIDVNTTQIGEQIESIIGYEPSRYERGAGKYYIRIAGQVHD